MDHRCAHIRESKDSGISLNDKVNTRKGGSGHEEMANLRSWFAGMNNL